MRWKRKREERDLEDYYAELYKEEEYGYPAPRSYELEEIEIESKNEYVWDSGLEYFKELVIQVPIEFLALLQRLEEELHTEFAFLLKIEENLPYIRIVDWYFPRQRVSTGDVEILERKEGYEGVVHRHPNKVECFSQVDWEYLNKNYKLSLIYCDGRITDCAYRVQIGNKYTWLTKFRVDYVMNVDIEKLIDKIEKG